MNSQRGKASTKASKTVMVTKTLTNGNRRARRQRNRNSNVIDSIIPRGLSGGVSVSYSTPIQQRTPVIVSQSNGSIRVRHREYIERMNSSTTFQLNRFRVNPANPDFAPWLANVAKNWTKYRFHSIKLIYIPRCASSTNGSINLACDIDPSNDLPTTEFEIMQLPGAVQDNVWKPQEFSWRVADLNRELLVGGVSEQSGQGDIRLFNLGNLFIAATDGDNSNMCGKVWVDYEVTLSNPTFSNYSQLTFNETSTGTSGGITALALFPKLLFDDGSKYDIIRADGIYCSNIANGNIMTVNNVIVGKRYRITVLITGTTITNLSFNDVQPAQTTISNTGAMLGGSTYASASYEFICVSEAAIYVTMACSAATVNTSSFVVASLS